MIRAVQMKHGLLAFGCSLRKFAGKKKMALLLCTLVVQF